MLRQEGEVRKHVACAVGIEKDPHYFEMARDVVAEARAVDYELKRAAAWRVEGLAWIIHEDAPGHNGCRAPQGL
jgi:hypothetical protein